MSGLEWFSITLWYVVATYEWNVVLLGGENLYIT